MLPCVTYSFDSIAGNFCLLALPFIGPSLLPQAGKPGSLFTSTQLQRFSAIYLFNNAGLRPAKVYGRDLIMTGSHSFDGSTTRGSGRFNFVFKRNFSRTNLLLNDSDSDSDSYSDSDSDWETDSDSDSQHGSD